MNPLVQNKHAFVSLRARSKQVYMYCCNQASAFLVSVASVHFQKSCSYKPHCIILIVVQNYKTGCIIMYYMKCSNLILFGLACLSCTREVHTRELTGTHGRDVTQNCLRCALDSGFCEFVCTCVPSRDLPWNVHPSREIPGSRDGNGGIEWKWSELQYGNT